MKLLYPFVFIGVVLLQTSIIVSAQTIRYVKPIATGTGTGDSWANAASDLSQVLHAANANDQVWIAAGTYYPTRDELGNLTPSDPRTRTFSIKTGLKVYGGFAGTETTIGDRIIEKDRWITTLSGDLGVANYSFDNAYNIVSLFGSSQLLDNVSVRNAGLVSGSYTYHGAIVSVASSWTQSAVMSRCDVSNNPDYGLNVESGGVPSTPALPVLMLKNCRFTYNTRGAIYSTYRSVSFQDCLFSNNTAERGGALNISAARGRFVNCKFLNNASTANYESPYNYGGGAIYAYGGGIELINCLFDGNRAEYTGAISMYSYQLTATNCTFVNNRSRKNSVVSFTAFDPDYPTTEVSLRSCIAWNNQNTSAGSGPEVIRCNRVSPTIAFSDVQACALTPGCATGVGNRSIDPLFLDGSTRLNPDSPLVNAGDPAASPGSLFAYDMAGLPRISGRIVDIGVYEHQMTDEITSITTENWNDPGTWSCVCIPTIHDVVRLRHEVLNPAGNTATARTIRYAPSGRLEQQPGSRLELGVRIWYVTETPRGAGNGTSWDDASDDLRAILAGAQANDEVWVAFGTYKPTVSEDRTLSFMVPSGVQVYGGFLGSETQLTQRQIDLAGKTILSGNIGLPDASDNTYHVVHFQDVAVGTLLDGFTIQDGGTQSNTEMPVPPGGYVGAGIYNETTKADSSPTIQNCYIMNNRAGSAGGGLYSGGTGTVTVRNCLFRTNYGENGGAIYSQHAGSSHLSTVTLLITNCDFVGNASFQGASGKAIDGGILTMKNSIVYNNTGNLVAGQIANLSDGSRISYSIVQDLSSGFAHVGSTVTNQNPKFVNYSGGSNDLRLRPDSPCIDAGDPADTSATIPFFDLYGQYRIFLGRVDMGCIEYVSPLY